MATQSFVSPEQKTITTTAYQVISIYGALFEIVALYLAISQYSIFPPMQSLFVLVCAPLVVVMIAFRKTHVGAVSSLVTQAAIIFSTSFSDTYSDARLSASSSIFLMCYFGITVFYKRVQLLWIFLSAFLWVWIVPGVPLYSSSFGDSVNLRWGTLIQLVVSGLALRYVWNLENERMQTRAEQSVQHDRDFANAISERQRLLSWRSSLARVHETILNDIRSILDSETINGDRILNQLTLSDSNTPPPTSKLSLKLTLAAVESQLLGYESITFEQIPNLSFDHQTTEQLKNVLVELCRNRNRHSGAKNLRIKAAKSGKHLVIRLVDDGEISTLATSTSGLGLGVVVREGLKHLKADLSETSGVKVLRMPLPAEEMTSPVLPPFSGRALLSTAMAANALGGGLAFVALVFSERSTEVLAGYLGFLVAVLAGWAAFRQGQIPKTYLFIAGISAGLVPLFVAETYRIASCAELEINLMAATLSSIGISGLVVWMDQKRFWIAAFPSAVGMVMLALTVVGSCDASVNPTLLASLFAPLLIVVVAYALRDSATREAAERSKALSHIKQIAETMALEDFSIRLHALVVESRSLMSEIASANKLTRKNKSRLMALDSAIRATIQVDPSTAGAFSLLAEKSVLQAVEAGMPTRVLVLQDSGDNRELPEFVQEIVSEFLVAAKGTASIQLLSNSSQDSMTVLASKLDPGFALQDFWQEVFEDGNISFNRGFKREPHILIVRRNAKLTH